MKTEQKNLTSKLKAFANYLENNADNISSEFYEKEQGKTSPNMSRFIGDKYMSFAMKNENYIFKSKININEIRTIVKRVLKEETENTIDSLVGKNDNTYEIKGIKNFKKLLDKTKNVLNFTYSDTNRNHTIVDVDSEGLITSNGKKLEWYYIDFEDIDRNPNIIITMEGIKDKKDTLLYFYPQINVLPNYHQSKSDVTDRFKDYEDSL